MNELMMAKIEKLKADTEQLRLFEKELDPGRKMADIIGMIDEVRMQAIKQLLH